MARKAVLLLEGGTVFEGRLVGAPGTAVGEVVFATAMTGYQEMCTDPSYRGQILTFTYPLIGNYGVHPDADQSDQIQVRGVAAREVCKKPSHPRASGDFSSWLAAHGVTGIEEIDTRMLTRLLRESGVQMGIISSELSLAEMRSHLAAAPRYDDLSFVEEVSAKAPYGFRDGEGALASSARRVAVVDLGVKRAILQNLKRRGLRVKVFPASVGTEGLADFAPEGVVFSPGPGDPAKLTFVEGLMRDLLRQIEEGRPLVLFGICLGHQVLARCYGAKTFKLKFGHRGANHPVRELASNRVMVTAQNHGYAVEAETLSPELIVSHLHVNDGTVEGLRHKRLPIFSVQFHPEAAPGPLDAGFLFDEFVQMMEAHCPEIRA